MTEIKDTPRLKPSGNIEDRMRYAWVVAVDRDDDQELEKIGRSVTDVSLRDRTKALLSANELFTSFSSVFAAVLIIKFWPAGVASIALFALILSFVYPKTKGYKSKISEFYKSSGFEFVEDKSQYIYEKICDEHARNITYIRRAISEIKSKISSLTDGEYEGSVLSGLLTSYAEMALSVSSLKRATSSVRVSHLKHKKREYSSRSRVEDGEMKEVFESKAAITQKRIDKYNENKDNIKSLNHKMDSIMELVEMVHERVHSIDYDDFDVNEINEIIDTFSGNQKTTKELRDGSVASIQDHNP